MTTFKGAMRTYGAAVRRIEREQQRQARESAKRFKEQQKQQDIQNAQQAVFDWEEYIETLQSVHKNCTEPVDWDQIKNTKKPLEPAPEFKNETFAKKNLDNYKPSFFDKLFGLTQKRIGKLENLLEQAKVKDKNDNHSKQIEYLDELQNWEELHEISIGIEKKNAESYKNALQYFNPFSDIKELGTQISINFESNFIDIDLHVNSLDVIPDYELKLTATSKLSKKNMPKTRFNELYQDHICSSALRVSREVFAYLPVEHVRINAMTKIVNGRTGYLEEQPILSAIFTSKTIESLNLEAIDPSDSMLNFVHNMEFNKTKGFSPVERAELKK